MASLARGENTEGELEFGESRRERETDQGTTFEEIVFKDFQSV